MFKTEKLPYFVAGAFFAAFLLAAIISLLSGEKTEVSASDTEALQGYTIRADKSEYVRIWTDPKTGVQYLLYTAVGRGGICPRYNADGSLMIEGE